MFQVRTECSACWIQPRATSTMHARHINDYEGDPVTEAAVTECIAQAERLLSHTREWLQTHRPDLASI